MRGEEGSEAVEGALAQGGGVTGAANWSEVAQKVLAHGRDWDRGRALLLSYGVEVEPVTASDADWAAARWRRGEGLSLADRLCLALGERLDATVWTADARWGQGGRVRQIR